LKYNYKHNIFCLILQPFDFEGKPFPANKTVRQKYRLNTERVLKFFLLSTSAKIFEARQIKVENNPETKTKFFQNFYF